MSEWTSTSGATSSKKADRFDLIPLAVQRCLAQRLAYGLENGAGHKWKRGIGDYEFIVDRTNHAYEHLTKLMQGDFSEETEWEHLGAVLFGCMIRACALEAQGDYTELYKPVPVGTGEVITPFTSDKNDDDPCPF